MDTARLAADIEGRRPAACAAWRLSGLEPLDEGVVALTCGAVQDGRPVVVKLNPRRHRDDAQLAAMDPGRAREWTRIRASAELVESGGWPGLRRMADALG